MSAHDAGELRPGFEPATRRLLPNGSDFGNKAREWDRKAFLYDTRRKWDRHVNRALALGGSAARIDRRSLKAQRLEAINLAVRARSVGRIPEAVRHEQRTQVLNLRPTCPRGMSPRLAAGIHLARYSRWVRCLDIVCKMDYRRWKRRMLSTVGRNAGPFAEMTAGAAHVGGGAGDAP